MVNIEASLLALSQSTTALTQRIAGLEKSQNSLVRRFDLSSTTLQRALKFIRNNLFIFSFDYYLFSLNDDDDDDDDDDSFSDTRRSRLRSNQRSPLRPRKPLSSLCK